MLGKIGIWSMELRFGDHGAANEAAAELDELGYGAIWMPGGIDGEVLGDIDRLLAHTKRAVIATGIINIWKQQPEDVAAWWQGKSAEQQARLLLGVGVSHAPTVGDSWGKPIKVTREWIERCTAAGVPMDRLCIAALGPQMVRLSGERTAGAHPYLANPDHTAMAREILGPDKLLAPEQGVILESDPARARELARGALDFYRSLPNYINNWRRLGFSEDEIASESDRFLDSIFAWGSAEQIAARVQQHLDAGADHVCMQVITGEGVDVGAARPVWRELAAVLL